MVGVGVVATPVMSLVVVIDVVVLYWIFLPERPVEQVTVWPPLLLAVQLVAFTSPVSVVWQSMVGCVAVAEAVQLLALTKPVSLVMLQVTVCPPLTEAVQRPELAMPVSVVWQAMRAPEPLNAPPVSVHDAAFTNPGAVVLQETRVPEPLNAPAVSVHDAALTNPESDVVQLMSERALPVMLLLLLHSVVEFTVLLVEAWPPLKLTAAAVMPVLPVETLTAPAKLPALAGAMRVTYSRPERQPLTGLSFVAEHAPEPVTV